LAHDSVVAWVDFQHEPFPDVILVQAIRFDESSWDRVLSHGIKLSVHDLEALENLTKKDIIEKVIEKAAKIGETFEVNFPSIVITFKPNWCLTICDKAKRTSVSLRFVDFVRFLDLVKVNDPPILPPCPF